MSPSTRLARAYHRIRLLLVLASFACEAPLVRWEEPRVLRGAGGGALAFDEQGAPILLASAPPRVPAPEGACPGSIRVVAATSRQLHAVWWSPRSDGSAALYAARSDDGGRQWLATVAVDTTDRGKRGCERPPAGLATGAGGAFVDVAYFLEPEGGPGVFLAHSMERGSLFHAPVAIVYGDRPSRASVAVAGDTVAVAYEDPNVREGGAVGLALSRTGGHIFEGRLPVSGSVAAESPAVALAPGRVAVAWRQGGATAAATVVRVGALGWTARR